MSNPAAALLDTDRLPAVPGDAQTFADIMARLDAQGTPPAVSFAVAAYVTALNAADARDNAEVTYGAKPGRYYVFALDDQPRSAKYLRITADHGSQGGSVHAFVERATGKIIKPATYKAPQKDKSGLAYRFDLLDADSVGRLQDALAVPGFGYGGYLYAR